ncbi:MAG: Uroporphyrinogen decarboxylase [Holosporales bacterium]
MGQLTYKSKFYQTCKGIVFDKHPIWMMRQAGRYLSEYRSVRALEKDFMSFCFNKDFVKTVTLQPIERFNFDAAIIFSDILVIPHALGQQVKFEAGEGPKLARFQTSFLKNDPTVALEPVYDGIVRTRESLDQSISLIGFAATPWTLGAYMIACEKIGDGRRLQEEVKGFKDLSPLMDKLTDSISIHLKNQIKAGADVVQLFDSWAGLCPLDATTYLVNPVKAILKSVWHDFPETPIIYYGRHVSHLFEHFKGVNGPLVLGVDQTTDLSNVLLYEKPTQGNLDPDVLIQGGKALESAIFNILEKTKGKPHIFNLGHGIKPETPVENVQKMIDLVRAF